MYIVHVHVHVYEYNSNYNCIHYLSPIHYINSLSAEVLGKSASLTSDGSDTCTCTVYMYVCPTCTVYVCPTCTLVMCDTYRYIEISIFSLNIVIQYLLLGVSIHWNGQFSKHGFSNLSNLIPKSNYNKLVCITFFYHFLTNIFKWTFIYIL